MIVLRIDVDTSNVSCVGDADDKESRSGKGRKDFQRMVGDKGGRMHEVGGVAYKYACRASLRL